MNRISTAALLSALTFSSLSAGEGLSMVSYPPPSQKLQIGQTVDVAVKINYNEVRPGTSIYMILSPMDGEALLLAEDSTINASKPNLSFCGSFKNLDTSLFEIDPKNNPISTSFKYTQIFQLLEGRFPKEQLDELKKSMHDEDLRLTFGFISTVEQRDGLTEGSIRFRVPNLPYYYDGVLLTPYFFSFDEKKDLCARYDGKNMHSVLYPVQPNRVKKPPKKIDKIAGPQGSVRITSYEPAGKEAVIGRPNTFNLTVRYAGLARDSAIYVYLAPLNGETIVSSDGASSTEKISFTTCKKEASDASIFSIPSNNQPEVVELPILGRMEAAQVVTVPAGGDGVASGSITFSPPLLPKFYNVVRLYPVVYSWTADGKYCTQLSGTGSESIDLPILGR